MAISGAATNNYEFKGWQRVVRYRYGLQPLHVTGSLRDPAGGRFNIGDLDLARYPSFPALYLAADRQTALQEVFCADSTEQPTLDAALAKPDSMVAVEVSGKLDTIIDIHQPERLEEFVGAIRTFSISKHLARRAQALNANLPKLIETVEELQDNLLSKTWRFDPMGLEIPSPSQIFGQLAAQAGVTGILFPSRYSDSDCLAIFPQNFTGTDSYVRIDGGVPEELETRLLNADVWRQKKALLCGDDFP